MEDQKKINKDLVHLSRLALSSTKEDVNLFVKRLVKFYQKDNPSLSKQLSLLISSNKSSTSLRSKSVSPIPVDSDSRLQLIRFESHDSLLVEPVLPKSIKDTLEQIIKERTRTKALLRADLLPTRSLLFTGEPGVGKSLTAKWLAHMLKIPLLTLDLSAVMSSFLGKTGTNVRTVLDYAKSTDCIIFLDELDAIAKRRADDTEIGELKRLVTVILQEIDNWPASGILIAATNHPDLLDPAVWRRFDLVVNFPMPNNDSLINAISNYLPNEVKKKHEWSEILATVLYNRSFSDIEKIILRLRRQSIINSLSLELLLIDFVKDNIGSLNRKDKTQIAIRIEKLGLSQRETSKLTGVSRDTIRKKSKI